jgi:succinyldiaminopimelate transaminase
MNNILRELKPYPMEELNRIKEELKRKNIKIYDFGTGDPREPIDKKIVEALKNSINEYTQYPSVVGKKELREAISKWFKRRFNVELDPDREIIPSNGSKEAIFHFPLVFIDASENKKKVLFGTPAYPVYERGTLFANGEPVPIKLKEEDKFLLRLDKLPKSLLEETKIVWINYPHNPTGANAPYSYFEEVYHICKEYDIILCSDECYTEIYFEEDKKPISALQVGRENIVVFHSLSKRSGLTGYRTGFVAGDEKIIQEYKKFRASFGVATPNFIQDAARVAWEDETHVEKRRKIYKEKRDIFIKFLRKLGLDFLYPEATFYIWIKIPNGDKNYIKNLLKNGIIVSVGENFCTGLEIKENKCSSNYFRIALVPTIDECKEAIKVWEKAHNEFINKK